MELLETFLRESDELIDGFEAGLVELEETGSLEIVHALFRAAHTLKGNAGMVGLSDFVRFTHVLENVLGRVRDGALEVNSQLIDPLLTAVDALRAMLQAAASGKPVAAPAPQLTALEAILGDDLPPPGAEPLHDTARDLVVDIQLECTEAEARARAEALLKDIADLGEPRELTPALRDGQRDYKLILCSDARRVDIEAIALFADAKVVVRELTPAKPASPPRAPRAATPPQEPPANQQTTRAKANVKVDAERLDALVDLTCEMVIASARAEQVQRDPLADQRSRADAMEVLATLVREVQERTMSLRMVAVRETFARFTRPVRDLARDLSKEVELEMSGLDTELDRKLLDYLADPLKHVIRNCIAHGIERPEQRVQNGKPRVGKLQLLAIQENGAAVIEVRDDGAGIDKTRVLAKAVQRGLIPAGAQLSDRQVYELLFSPGFSTAERIDEVAGRGVGLDVLKRSVDALRGTIEILSEVGIGTLFRIRLPVTLAIVDGMHVRVGQETLTFPLPSVVELLDGRKTPIGKLEGNQEFVDVRGQILPVVRLARVLELPELTSDMIVVVQSERRRFGVVVDDVIGLARAVIKPLERSYAFMAAADHAFEKPAGVSGATVLGDGRVGLIVDVPGLENMAFGA
ncbi:MAG TPA: chemotaxis protein CheA [Polyangiales bacterium]|nr:chemotaxis protein CheA [Polyangiales bacterium]